LAKFIEKLFSDNKSAFKQIYHDEYEHVYRFIFSKLSNHELSKDFCQETFAKLWQNLNKVDLQSNLRSYLFRISQNMVIDHYRKKSTQNEYAMEENFDVKDEQSVSDDVETILILLDSVPTKHREAFLLNRRDGFKYKEIAGIFDVSPKTIESWMGSVLKHLRENFEKD
jgi:RNA polymerase sigma factor (sigma-70 family)